VVEPAAFAAAERLIWAVWIGYLIAYLFMNLTMHAMGHKHLDTYALSLLLSGLAFFIMGCHVWGWCYVIGLAFMIGAPLMAYSPDSEWAPFWFGAMWGLALFIIGGRYWWLGRTAPA
jgi:hypothetical protein